MVVRFNFQPLLESLDPSGLDLEYACISDEARYLGGIPIRAKIG
jgi:hypothetical protein